MTEAPVRGAASALIPNNFDLIRLAAAVQVVAVHLADNVLGIGASPWVIALRMFPGVPIFFFTSGFLISASWERNPSLRTFAVNRFLRIYPALAAVFVLSLGAIFLFYPALDPGRNVGGLLLWSAAQLTVFQSWNPPFLRGYGMGVANGSLWTVPVEIAFYAAIPVFYWLFRITRRPNLLLILVIAGSAVLGAVLAPRLSIWMVKALSLSPVTVIGIFCSGILAQRHRDILVPLAVRWPVPIAIAHVCVMLLAMRFAVPVLLGTNTRFFGLANLATLDALVLAAAFCAPSLAGRLLHRQDISYGLYLVHNPISNMMLANAITGVPAAVLTAIGSIAVACLSWFAIERPALARKTVRLYAHDRA